MPMVVGLGLPFYLQTRGDPHALFARPVGTTPVCNRILRKGQKA